jgi:NAD(P)-dependent dehydrogenase (short-subunit alcohol dehydrogenase family)
LEEGGTLAQIAKSASAVARVQEKSQDRLQNRLHDKIVLVTGAAGAIGAAVCTAIEQAGGMPLASDLEGHADIALDVTLEDDWRRAHDDIAREHGRLDGLVNAAGIAVLGTVEELDLATWRRVLSVNLDGTFLGCKFAMPLLRRNGGAIVNMSSVSGLVGGHNLAAYNASKGGVSLLSKSVALYGARLRPPVRCNAICPAFIEGPMVDDTIRSAKHPERALEKFTSSIPLGRLGRREEVAALCFYLLSDDAGFTTGADYPIDGGLTAR